MFSHLYTDDYPITYDTTQGRTIYFDLWCFATDYNLNIVKYACIWKWPNSYNVLNNLICFESWKEKLVQASLTGTLFNVYRYIFHLLCHQNNKLLLKRCNMPRPTLRVELKRVVGWELKFLSIQNLNFKTLIIGSFLAIYFQSNFCPFQNPLCALQSVSFSSSVKISNKNVDLLPRYPL